MFALPARRQDPHPSGRRSAGQIPVLSDSWLDPPHRRSQGRKLRLISRCMLHTHTDMTCHDTEDEDEDEDEDDRQTDRQAGRQID